MFSLLRTGDHAIFQSGIYGGTHHAIINELEKFGIEYSFIEDVSEEAIAEVKKDNSRIIYFETPTNPLLEITDLELAGALSKKFGLTSIVDNTFASPVNQNPIQFGIDAVIHSGTKYLGGHSDLSCGAIISSKGMIEKCWNSAIHFGGNLNSLSVYLLERSLKTLSIRVEQQNRNALQLAIFLEGLPQVKKVNYPGLESHIGHSIAKRQMSGFGGMMSFELDLSENQIDRFLKHLKVLHPSISLGGVETIISSPALTSHAKMSEEERRKIGITNQLLRLSVGIENVEDLTLDIESALEKVDVLV